MRNNSEIIRRIRLLQQKSKQLEPGNSKRKDVRNKVIQYTEQFLENIYKDKAFKLTKSQGIGIYSSPITEEPINTDAAIKLFKENVDDTGLNPASGGHLGYIPGGGIYFSSLADYLAAITNRYAGVFFPSPGAVRMENMLIDWMAKIIGYPKTASGNLASGGSIANLIGIVTARDAFNLKAKDFHKCVVYMSEQAHHSIEKSIRIAGLKEVIIRYIPLDHHYRINSVLLENTIKNDRRKKLKPWLIIASAGTTDTGAVDPINEIGDIAIKNNLWFHVDAAYGGFFILCKEGKKILKGLDKTDSIVMDPHKGLFLPYGLGAILVKDKSCLYKSHYYQANYLQDAVKVNDELSPADLSPELTKHFRGLRLWLPLKLLGVKPFRAAIEEKLWLARYFYHKIKEIDGFEVGPYPDLSVVIFRYIPKRGDPNKFNELLIEEIQKDGQIFLSSTMINKKYFIRVAVLSFRSHIEIIDTALEVLKKEVNYLIKKE